MSRHEYQQKILPKYVDSDTEVRYVNTGNQFVRYALNGRVGKRDNTTKGAWTKIKGTLYIPNNYLPSGENKCIGSVSNETKTFLIFFNWNSNFESGIYIYNPSFEEPIQLLFKDTVDNIILCFNKYFRIKGTKATIVQDEHLFWTDIYNAPRYLNIPRAIDYKKKKIYEIQTPIAIKGDIPYNVEFTYKGNIVDVYNGLGRYGSVLGANEKLRDYFDVENCDCGVELTEKEANTTTLTSNSTNYRIVPQNFYSKPHNERQIDLVTYPLSTAPSVVLKKDVQYKRNFISGDTWQFRVKIIYFDNNESVWSAWSKQINTSGECAEEYNYIEIDYTDNIFNCFNDIQQLEVIKAVVIGYRNTNLGTLHSFVTVKQCEIPTKKQTYKFYNDIFAQAEPEYDDKVKQYDAVPLKTGAMTTASNRLLLADNTENYEEDCFDFDVDVNFTPRDAKLDSGIIRAELRIMNEEFGTSIPIMQVTENTNIYYYGIEKTFGSLNIPNVDVDKIENIDQKLALTGFTAYLVGTDYKAISVQKGDGVDFVNKKNEETGISLAITTNDKSKIGQAITDKKDFYQYFEFTGVKDGTYIMRVASHWVGYDDKLAKGSAYDLDNGLQWHKTSTNIYGTKEFVVTVLNGSTTTPIPMFALRDCMVYQVNGGAIQLDLTPIQGYVIDSDVSTQVGIYGGKRVENATVRLIRKGQLNSFQDVLITQTDHNGYFFGRIETRPAGAFANAITVAKDRNNSYNVIAGGSGEMAILGIEDNPFVGNLSQLQLGTCTTFNNNDSVFDNNTVTNLIVPFLVTDSHNITNNFSTEIKGKITDTIGNPIKGLLVSASETSRTDTTDQNGDFSIILYSNYDSNRADKRSVKLIINGDFCNNAIFTQDYIITLGGNNNNLNKPFDIGTIKLEIEYKDLLPSYYLKNGGTYDIGVTLMDRALRKTTVISSENKHRIRLPFTTENIQDYLPNLLTDTTGATITPTTKADGYFTFTFKPKTLPPIWSTELYILRTQDQVYEDYIQMVVSDVKYVLNYAETEDTDGVLQFDPNITTYANNDANEIYLDLTTSFIEYKNRKSNSVKGWAFEKGDRLRFLYNVDGTLFEFIETEVKEQRGNYFVIDNIDSLKELKQGIVVEIFRLRTKTTKKVFYEIAEYNKVIDRYTNNASWEKQQILLNTGDCYRRLRKMYAKYITSAVTTEKTVIRTIEDITPDDTYQFKDNDIGRADFINEQYKQIEAISTIRFSDTILTDSNINNIRRFDVEQKVTGNNNYGRITVIDSFANTIFIAQDNKCHTRLIGKTNAYLGDGGIAVFNTNNFISDAYYLNEDYGCINGDSYARCYNQGVFFDAVNGCVVSYYQQNGLNNISGYDDRYRVSKHQESIFKNLGKNIMLIPMWLHRFIVEFNSVYNEYENEINISLLDVVLNENTNQISFNGFGLNSNIGKKDDKFKVYEKENKEYNIQGFTMCYDNEDKYWLGNRSYNPTAYGILNNRYIGFVGGDLHLMEQADENSYNIFFGIAYSSILDVIMNKQPSETKYFKNWSVESNMLWENPYVKIDNSRAYRLIESETPNGKITKKLGGFYAPFMFDKNTENVQYPLINGNRLVGEALLMRLENKDNTNVILFCINIYAGYVSRTNF